MNPSAWGRRIAIGVLVAGLGLSPSVLAQGPFRGESEVDRLLRQQEMEQERRRMETLPEDLASPAPPSSTEAETKAEKDALCFDITRIEVAGVTVLPMEEIDAVTQGYVGQCMGRNAIAELIEAINGLYLEHGYITTRAYLPKQNLSQGVLRLSVVEGRVESLHLNQDSDRDKRQRWFSFDTEPDDILNIRDIEQGLDQINSVPSGRATVRLWPGEAVGGTRVEVTNTPQDAFRLNANADNYGQKGTGEKRIRVGMDVDNLLGANDTWSLSYLGSRDTNALLFRLGWTFRRWSFSYTRSYSEYLSVLGEFSELFGQTDTQYGNADYLLYRDSHHLLKLTGGLSVRESERYINDVQLTPQQLTVASMGVEHVYRTRRWQWLGSLGLSRGLDALGASEDLPRLDSEAPHAQFNKVTFNANLSWHLSDDYYYRGFLLAQYSPDSLYGSEQLHLGDVSTVRGFNYQPASGDSGAFARNDLLLLGINRYFDQMIPRVSPEFSVFLDAGGTHSVGRDFYGDTSHVLVGSGLALSLRSPWATAQATVGYPVFADESALKDGLQLSFTVNFKVM